MVISIAATENFDFVDLVLLCSLSYSPFSHITLLLLSRMQAEAAYQGMSDVFRRTLRKEGYRGFYKGIFPNLLKVVPAASITYLVYETMKKSLELG